MILSRLGCAVLFACATFHLLARVAAAQVDDPPKDVSETLRKAIADHDLPGMVAVVIEGDRVVATGAAGVRQRGGGGTGSLPAPFPTGSPPHTMHAPLC